MDRPITKRRIKLWLMCILTILVSAFSVLSDLIKFEGNGDTFTPWFWLNLILTNVSAVIIIFLANSTEKDIQIGKNKRYLELSDGLFASFKDLNTKNLRQSFSEYIENDNATAKKDAYFRFIHKKISRCERAIGKKESRYNAFRLFFRRPIVEEPKTLLLVMWRSRLNYWKSRLQAAEKDVKYAVVRYLKVTEDSIFGSSDERHRASRDMSYHAAQHNFEILIKKFLIVLIFGFAASLGFTFAPVVLSVEFFYKTAIRLFQLGMALYTGISDADRFVEGDMCDALYRRIAYVQKFKENVVKSKE